MAYDLMNTEKVTEFIIEIHFSKWSDELNHKLDFFMMKKINSYLLNLKNEKLKNNIINDKYYI